MKRSNITMKLYKNLNIFIIYLLIFIPKISFAQESKPIVEIGLNKIKLNEPFIISIISKNEEERPKFSFPEINGFKKRGVSFATSPSIINGKPSVDQKISQEYMPVKTGNYSFSNYKVQVNDEPILAAPFTVIVVPSEKNAEEENFKDFIDGSAYEFVDVKDDAFFAITTNKLKPYVGQGFMITIAFYIAKNNKAELNFFNENLQLDAILKKIRPKNCWEENLGISEIKGNNVINIGNKKYLQYKIYQALYFPFNNQSVVIPPQNWQMLKYKIAKDQEVSKSKKEDYKTYLSKSIIIRPLTLPKNPKYNTDFVGDFGLVESLNKEKVQTGRSFTYNFKIIGNGNLRNIKFNESLSDTLFEIYEPQIVQQITNNLPEKSFSFNIVPKFAGKYSLKDHFFIDYFNTRTKTYETLRASKQIEVLGNDIDIEEGPVSQENDLYENIANLKSDETSFDFREAILKFSNILIIAMLVAMIYIFWPTKK
jgi:hypothetical protein